MSIFGSEIAILYVLLGLLVAILGGAFIEKMHLEQQVEDIISQANCMAIHEVQLSRKDRLQYAKEQVKETFQKVFPYIVVGVAIGAFIHNWIPKEWITSLLGSHNPFGVILATIVGIPMYADIFGKRSRSWQCPSFHDGGNYLKFAIFDYVKKGFET